MLVLILWYKFWFCLCVAWVWFDVGVWWIWFAAGLLVFGCLVAGWWFDLVGVGGGCLVVLCLLLLVVVACGFAACMFISLILWCC